MAHVLVSTVMRKVPVNYAESHAIAKAIIDNTFNSIRFNGVDLDHIPLVGFGEAKHEVLEAKLDETLDTPGVIASIDARESYKFVDPLTALRYACHLPERQQEYPLVTIFRVNDLYYSLLLNGDPARRHCVFTIGQPLEYTKEGLWPTETRFLVNWK